MVREAHFSLRAEVSMVARGLVSILFMLLASLGIRGSDLDSNAHPTAAPLPFFYDLYTFRTDGGGTTVVAAIAVQARRLRWDREGRQVRYRFDVRFVLADTLDGSAIPSLDSVFVSTPSPLPRQHLLHTYVEVQAPPSTATLQRLVVTDANRPGVGQLYTSPFVIPDYSGSELMLSDIALGLPDARAGWTRRGVTLALLPTSLFPESAFDVYYEIYNLPTGSQYETEFMIEPLDDSDEGEGVVRTFFTGEANSEDGTVAELRRVQSALEKGRYRMTVTVRDQSSTQVAMTSRVLEVRGWGSGTTLVPALRRGGGTVLSREE